MAYAEFNNVPNVQTLIDLVVQFAQANGWTVERNTLSGANRTATVRIPGVSDYVHLFNTGQDSLRSRISIGYDGGATPAQQPLVSPRDILSYELTGPFPRLKLFANGTAIHAAIAQAVAGEYRHHAFGVLEKAGDYPGGTYVDGTYWARTGSYSGMLTSSGNNVVLFGHNTSNTGCGHVRADSTEDGRINSYSQICNYYSGALATEGQAGSGVGSIYQSTTSTSYDSMWMGYVLAGSNDNTFSGRSIFQPINLSIRRPGTNPYLSPIGQVIGLRACYMERLEPEQEVTIGDDTWTIFPWLRKAAMNSATNAPPASGNYGWAIRKS